MEKELLSYISSGSSGNAKWYYNAVDGNLAILAKLHLPFVLEISLLGIYPIDALEKLSKHVCTRSFISALVITKNQKKLEVTKISTIRFWLNKIWCTHSMNSLQLKGTRMISIYHYGAISRITIK